MNCLYRVVMKKAIIILSCSLMMILITACQTPSQNATKRPDTMGSATTMLNGHRRTKKTSDDDIKKILGVSSLTMFLSGTYYIYSTKRKRG